MYTEEQYRRAKAALAEPGIEAKVGAARVSKWVENVAEYEANQTTAQPPAAAPSLSEQDLARLQTPLAIGGPLENESIAPDYQYHPPEDFDDSLPNASKRKKWAEPPEHVTKRPGAALANLAKAHATDPLNGFNRNMYFEPTEKQFQADMGEYLKAKDVLPGGEEYGLAYADYKDRKWAQAYKEAEAKDEPLLRVAYVPQNAPGWTKLQVYLAEKSDAASAFAQGFASGGSFGLTRTFQSNADREQLARHPIAEGIGEFGGAVSPGSLVGKLAGGIGRTAGKLGAGRYGAAALSGGLSTPVDIAAHTGADALSDRLHGRPVDQDAKSQFGLKLLGGSLLGGIGGVAGEGIASLSQRYRVHLRSPTDKLGTELTNAESSGTATDALSGLEPSSDVNKYLDKARGPVPGEDRPLPTGNAVEYAEGAVRGPLVAQHAFERDAALQRMERESGRMFDNDSALRQPKSMGALVRALREHILERSQPEAAGQFLPGPGQALGARNNSQLIDFARRLIRPRLALDVDAAKEAARHGGEVVSLEDAERMGFPVKGLENEINPTTGLPHNAPTLSGEPAPDKWSRVNSGEILEPGAPPTGEEWARVHSGDIMQPGDAGARQTMATVPDDGAVVAQREGAALHAPANDVTARPANSNHALHEVGALHAPGNDNILALPPGTTAKQFRVILEPRAYDAMKMEAQIKAIDQAGKAGTEAKVDPVWPELMRAARIDREQFGKAWSGLKNVHHEQLTELEQRAAHAGIIENQPYDKMSGNAQKTANAAITNYGVAPKATNEALAGLADNAGVRQDLETLRGTRAYSALKEKALPSAHDSIGQGGSFLRLGGLLPGAKLRADALARNVARGPEGNPLFAQTFNPKLVNEPLGREIAPSGPFANILSMGRGALGVKTGSVYDSGTGRAGPGSTLSPEEKATLQKMLETQ